MIPGLSQEENQFYLDNPTSFVQDFLSLKGKPLVPYSYQCDVLNFLPRMEPHLEDQLRILHVLGARQIFGKSTTAAMLGAWFSVMHDHSETIIISHRQRRSNKMLGNIKRFFLNKPILKSMTNKGGNKQLRWSATDIELTTNTTISSLPEGNDADSSVGDATNLVIIDEVARFKNADSIKAAIMPTIFETNGVIVMFSSSWGSVGKGQYWFELIEDCRDRGSVDLVELDALQCLEIQKRRWEHLLGEEKAYSMYNKKIAFLDDQKVKLGRYLYEMQYMNSFESGLENAFERTDLKKCFTNFAPRTDPEDGHTYITTVDFGKSLKTGDKSVISTYDLSDVKNVKVIRRDSYSQRYTYVTERIIDRVMQFPGGLFCDIGGGENQVETLYENKDIYYLGIKPIAVVFSNNLQRTASKDYEDKGITRRMINKLQNTLRLQRYIQYDNETSIRYCRGCDRSQYEDYVEIITPSGMKKFGHPPNGHDDEVDTDLMAMDVVSQMCSVEEYGPYSAGSQHSLEVYKPLESYDLSYEGISVFAM